MTHVITLQITARGELLIRPNGDLTPEAVLDALAATMVLLEAAQRGRNRGRVLCPKAIAKRLKMLSQEDA
jgi:hypothetical protein